MNDSMWSDILGDDQKGLKSLYDQYFDNLYSFGCSFYSDQMLVEDCIQELFLSIWEKRHQLKKPDNIKGYLIMSLRNNILSKIKSKSKTQVQEIDERLMGGCEISIENKLIDSENTDERMQKLAEASQNLKPRQKEILYLKFSQGLSYEEISEIMDINYQSARNLLHRTLIKLRTELMILFFLFSATFLSTKSFINTL